MSRDPESVRFELDYLRELLHSNEESSKANSAVADELHRAIKAAGALAALEAERASASARLDQLTVIVKAGAAAMSALLEAAHAIGATGDLLGGRILALAEEAGLELPPE